MLKFLCIFICIYLFSKTNPNPTTRNSTLNLTPTLVLITLIVWYNSGTNTNLLCWATTGLYLVLLDSGLSLRRHPEVTSGLHTFADRATWIWSYVTRQHENPWFNENHVSLCQVVVMKWWVAVASTCLSHYRHGVDIQLILCHSR